MGVSIHVNQEGWRHEMRCLLRLFVQHKAICVPDQRSVVCVEEHLVWKLCGHQEKKSSLIKRFGLTLLLLLRSCVVGLFTLIHTYFWMLIVAFSYLSFRKC